MKTSWKLAVALCAGLLPEAITGCAVDPATTGDPAEVQLGALLPAGAQPVGVAVSPEGRRYVLDRLSGLYELGAGTARLVFKTSELASRYGQRPDLDLTDVVALGSQRFAITAENDGFLLDLYGGTFSSYFCYLPAPGPDPSVMGGPSISQTLRQQGIDVKQRTESVAVNADGSLLFAQPQTFRMDTGAVAGSELFVFNAGGGQPVQVRAITDSSFVASGMVALAGDRLLLGSGNAIYEVTATRGPTLVKQLDAAIQIAGMARQPDGALLLLDRAANRLVTTAAP